MSDSVWPYEIFQTVHPPLGETNLIRGLTCFVVCPFNPKKRWDDLFNLLVSVCTEIGGQLYTSIQCKRGDSDPSTGIIQPEIWNDIRSADFVVCDVTDCNPNVMLELGVASAIRKKSHVIILREKNSEVPYPFDINPARYLEYDVSIGGAFSLQNNLRKLIFEILASSPFEPILERDPIRLPYHASLSDGIDRRELYTPDYAHRLIKNDYLEFGALYSYQSSWLSLGDIKVTNIQLKADMKITLSRSKEIMPWMGIMVRGESFFANFGHLIYCKENGEIIMTVPQNELGQYQDLLLGKLSNFYYDQFTNFDILMDQKNLTIKIGSFCEKIPLSELPYVYTRGRIIFIGAFCRVGIKNISVNPIE